jgi:hypothetical protein
MTLKDFLLGPKNNFVAMEYYWLILNRTFLILLTDDFLIGIQGNGNIATEGGKDIYASFKVKGFDVSVPISINHAAPYINKLVVRGDLSNPYSYLKVKYIEEVEDIDLTGDSFLKIKANFRINRREIKNVYHDSRKKWGMGYYPHDGKVYIETLDNKKKELIILGNQSGQKIVNWINNK